MNLTNKQKQHLKTLAHSLKPTVMLGTHGLTEGVMVEIKQALAHHELIKVKIVAQDRTTKQLIVAAIVRESDAYDIQLIGNILTLYRPSEKNKIKLPA